MRSLIRRIGKKLSYYYYYCKYSKILFGTSYLCLYSSSFEPLFSHAVAQLTILRLNAPNSFPLLSHYLPFSLAFFFSLILVISKLGCCMSSHSRFIDNRLFRSLTFALHWAKFNPCDTHWKLDSSGNWKGITIQHSISYTMYNCMCVVYENEEKIKCACPLNCDVNYVLLCIWLHIELLLLRRPWSNVYFVVAFFHPQHRTMESIKFCRFSSEDCSVPMWYGNGLYTK